MQKLTERDFRLIMLPLKNPKSEWAPYYRQALQCWIEVWQKVQQNFNLTGPLFTDGFTRQDEAACLFTETRCAGMMLFRTIDFQLMDYQKDSYFRDWTPEDISQLRRHGSKVFMAVYLTVHPEFRNFSPTLKFKQVLIDILTRRFLDSDADMISAMARCERGINDESLKLGAEFVRQDVSIFNGLEKVDLMVYPRAKTHMYTDPVVRQFSDDLWQRRMDWMLPESPFRKVA
jgi:hypothetical protein